MSMQEALLYMVLEIVREIPQGYVVSYRQLAEMAGYPRQARLVGRILSEATLYGQFPCHRVVHQDGSLVPFWPEQRTLLEAEGICFKPNGKVNMKQCQWRDGNGNQIGDTPRL